MVYPLSNFAFVTAAFAIFAVVTLTSAIFAVVTLASAIFAVVTLASAILTVVTSVAISAARIVPSKIFCSRYSISCDISGQNRTV
jgi:hypothetical protein